ncbi:MAG: 50S ribosome-binding GTPase [Methanospirillaceae archaeon]|nr:50S ribosome-binding GTPase [Methanospirillaceae archaeon]
MELEKIPTIPNADEILDRSLRRAAKRMREKSNKRRAHEEFVRTVYESVHDRLVAVMQSYPEIDTLPIFYQKLIDILYGIDRLRQSLGAVAWAARWTRDHKGGLAKEVRYGEDTAVARKRAIARLASVVHQVDDDLLFLNEVRNVLRKIPTVEDTFTIVIAGYPNVGKSSFIRRVSTAEPMVASYPFTTKEVIVGHCDIGADRVQLIDTPGVLDRPANERNAIEQQAMAAIMHVADVILFLIDASEHCGYSIENQLHLLSEIRSLVTVPLVAAVNKADLSLLPGYPNISTGTGEGVDALFKTLCSYRSPSPVTYRQ